MSLSDKDSRHWSAKYLFRGVYWCFGFPRWLSSKESACQSRRHSFDPWVGKIPWSREWLSTPVLLPGKSHGQKSLVGYSPWGWEASDTTERLSTHRHWCFGVVVTRIDAYIYIYIFFYNVNVELWEFLERTGVFPFLKWLIGPCWKFKINGIISCLDLL